MYELIKRDGMAKRGRLMTVHGTIETPVFMNVGTAAAISSSFSFVTKGFFVILFCLLLLLILPE